MRIQSLLDSPGLLDSRRGLGHAGRTAFTRLSDFIARYEARIAQFLFICAALMLACTAQADTLTLANGDRLSGTIVASDGNQVSLKTDFAGTITVNGTVAVQGTITVQWSAVRQVTSTAPLYVVTPQGATVGGIVTTEGAHLLVTPSSGTPERIPLANATVIRGQAEETS